MAGGWRTVRVFISSTFRDMHSERDWLVRRVFPALREKLEPFRIHLVDIDLRWGVTESQAESGGALDVCLQQIDECRPFFLGLLGERYGWVPASISPHVLGNHEWIEPASAKSITELEIVYGVLRNPEMHPFSYFCYRDPAFLKAVPDVLRDGLCSTGDDVRKLTELKATIERTIPAEHLIKNYACRYAGLKLNWRLARRELQQQKTPELDQAMARLEQVAADGLVDPREYSELDDASREIVHRFGSVQLNDLNAFGDAVHDWLWKALKRRFNLSDDRPARRRAVRLDLQAEEDDYHARFMESRLRVYVGRQRLGEQLRQFADRDETAPCLVIGAPGSGKSAAMARFASTYAAQNPQVLVVPHFIGASPASTNLRQMLRRFCLILKREFQLDGETPQDVSALTRRFGELLREIPQNRRVVFVIDALNQLDKTDNAKQLHWLPWRPPAHVKLVTSCLSSIEDASEIPATFDRHPHHRIPVEPLADEERREIIREIPSLSAKTLDEGQVDLLLANPATKDPLFLLVALEELRGFGSFEQLNHRIHTLPQGELAATKLFGQVLARLEEEFHPSVVRLTLACLACSRSGLSQQEMVRLLPDNTGTAQADELFAVLRQLRPYLQPRREFLDFHHQQLSHAVERRYLANEKNAVTCHRKLARLFSAAAKTTAESADGSWNSVNPRGISELPYHLLQAGEIDAAGKVLMDLEFIEAKAEAQLVDSLLEDYRESDRHFAAIPGSSHLAGLANELLPLRYLPPAWQAFADFVRSHVHVLYRSGALTIPAAYNSSETGPVATAAATVLARRPRSRFAGLQLADRPPFVEHPALMATLDGHPGDVTDVALSHDLSTAVTGCSDGRLRVWDLRSGVLMTTIDALLNGPVTAVAVTRDGGTALTTGADGCVRFWETRTGLAIGDFPASTAAITSMALDGADQLLVTGDEEGQATVHQCASRSVVAELCGHFGAVTSVTISADGSRVVTGGQDGSIKLWNAITGDELASLEGHDARVRGVAIDFGLRTIVSASGNQTGPDGMVRRADIQKAEVRFWNAADGACLAVGKGHVLGQRGGWLLGVLANVVFDIAMNPSADTAVSVGYDRMVCVWDANQRQLRTVLAGHTEQVLCAAIDDAGLVAVTGAADGTIRVWDLAGTSPEPPAKPPGVARVGRRVPVGFDRKAGLIWANDRVRFVLTHIGAAAILSATIVVPLMNYFNSPEGADWGTRFTMSFASLFMVFWSIQWRSQLKRDTSTWKGSIVPVPLQRILSLLLLPLFPILKVVHCPACGRLMAGRRRWFACRGCGWHDRLF